MQRAQNKHDRDMQRTVLIGIVSLTSIVFVTIVLGVTGGLRTPLTGEFAQMLTDKALVPLIGIVGVAVGYFFGKNRSQ